MSTEEKRRRRGWGVMGTAVSLRGEEGFTLAELLVTTLIMIILLIGVGGMIQSGAKSSTASFNLVRMEDAANEAVNTMVRQIRVTKSINQEESDNGRFKFWGDFNGDGSDTDQEFMVQDGFLFKDGEPWVEGVSGVTFTYYWYNTASRSEELLDLENPPINEWAGIVHRVVVTLDMSADSLGITLERSYHGSATIMNALR